MMRFSWIPLFGREAGNGHGNTGRFYSRHQGGCVHRRSILFVILAGVLASSPGGVARCLASSTRCAADVRMVSTVSSTAQPRPILDVRRLGRTRYEDAYALQQKLVAERVEGKIADTLVLTEHEPVITLGRGSKREDVAGVQLPVFEIERGGEATWHGPGQVVAYPILLLPESSAICTYMRDLEEVVLRVLAEIQVEGRREPGKTGVWIGSKKVCSIGVAVRRWVTFHGLAINVNNDHEAFLGFNPCGLDASVMTRLADHAELPPANILIEVLLIKHFTEVFGHELPPPARPSRSDAGPRFPELPILG